MTPSVISASHTFPIIPGYSILEQLYLGSRTAVYRGLQKTQNHPVVIKVLRNEHPNFGEIVQFRNQYAITKNLPVPGIVHPLSLELLRSGYALIMEDWGGIALSNYLQQASLTLSEILAIALQLADILYDLSQHQVVHKDIKPANILIQPESKQVKLIDFSIASLLPKETQEIQSANILEGTLAYLAPEQTGRMNRGIDYRADFYALGVTLYQLLTGSLPFQSDDPLELVHCHIAQAAMPVDQVNPEVPAMVVAIVSKLMAKNAEDRYQSALGLKHDLEQCLTQWEETSEITEFKLGQRDLSDRFLIPEKLYGRDREVQTLLQAFDRVANGSSELMLVAGFSGIGKTAVVNEVHKPIVRQRGYFIKGKFDQFNRNIPLSAFVQALRDLMGQLLSESDIQLQQWRIRILQAVGENGQVLVEVIPELEQVIGKQPPAPELSGAAAQNRFNLLFQKFIEVFTRTEHPLVMFLDDLQWADSASLQLIKLLMNDNGYLLMLGAYRDNEVSSTHPFMMTVAELQKAGNIVNTITLKPLKFEDTNHLITDTLNCSAKLAEPLTKLIDRKTQGNPFFTTQFLKALYEDGYIHFARNRHCWECDIAQVNALTLTDDVVEFMALQLQKLPDETQQVLKLAACIGNQFDLATLAIVSERSSTETATALWKALQEGLLLPTSQIYKFFQGTESSDIQGNANPTYRFLHDRVQQAAYSLIPEQHKQVTHWKIGQLLLQGRSPQEQVEQIFDIVNQLNLGRATITNPAQKHQLAQLNLQAGQKAKLSAAYQSAQNYCEIGIDLLPVEAWQIDYILTYTLHRDSSEAAYLCGHFDRAEALYAATIAQAQTPLDKAAIYRVQMTQYQLQGRNTEAIEIQRQSLQLLGWTMPINPESIQASLDEQIAVVNRFLEKQSIESILELPKMEDGNLAEILRILQILFYAAWLDGQPTLALLALAKMTTLSLQHGNSEMSPFGYVGYGLIANALLKDAAQAYQFGDMAVQLCEQFDNADVRGMTNFLFAADVHSWSRPLRAADTYYDQAFKYGMDAGNWLTVGFTIMQSGSDRLTYGKNLDELYAIAQTHAEFLRQVKSLENLDALIVGVLQPIRHLLGLTTSLLSFDDAAFSEAEYLQQYQDAPYNLAWFYSVKIRHAFLFHQQTTYPTLIPQLSIIEETIPSHAKVPSSVFIVILMHLALIETSQDEAERQSHWQAILPLEERLTRWQQDCPANIHHKCLLVKAEKARLSEQKSEAIDLYDRAIAGAKENGYIQEEALANELAAKFYLNWGKEKIAAVYMQESYYSYAHWGAKAKVHDLEQRYPNLLRPILERPQSFNLIDTLTTLSEAIPKGIASPKFSIHTSTQTSPLSSSSSINTTLDFAAVLRASQSLSSTIQLDDLLRQLSQIILQNSGADRCILILPNPEGEWEVRAIATPEDSQLCHSPLQDSLELPTKLIYYVKNTKEVVIIDDCQSDLPVIDEYLIQRRPKSILCLPILNQGNLIGILYLKNRLTRGVFTSDRLLILNFLCTQAAISLENARLYSHIHKSQRQLTQLLNNLNGIVYSCANDENWTMKFISGGCFNLTGYLIEDFIDNHQISFAQLIHPDDVEMVDVAVQSAVKNNQPYQMIYRLRTKQGEEKWVWEQGQGVFDQEGEFLGLEGFVTDISDRKRAEIALQEKEAEYRSIFESVNDGLSITDLETGQVVAVNPVLCQMHGYTPEEFAHLTPVDLLHPDSLHLFSDYLTVLNSGQQFSAQGLSRRKDGSFFDFESKAVPFLYKGKPHGLSISRDISDRKQAELALQASQAELLALFTAMEDIILVIDSTGKYLKIAPCSTPLLYRPSTELLGKTIHEVLPVEFADFFLGYIHQALSTGKTTAVEYDLLIGEKTIWFDARIIPMENNTVLCMSRDISERKAAEALIQQKNQDLEQALIQVQQSQAQVVQSEKMSALGNLVAGVAHEINNPIGFLKGSINNAQEYVQDLLDYVALYQQHHPNAATPVQDKAEDIDLEFLSTDLPQLLDSMKGATDRITAISNSLRTFSRADTEYKVSANLHDGIDSTILILKYRLKANEYRPDIEVIQDYGYLPSIYCFPGQLNQVFMNILANAIDMFDEMAQTKSVAELKATPQQITIRTTIDTNQVQIEIFDNGKGMTEEVKAQIFDHLFTTKGVGKGTGLGLAIARQIVVDKHGGSLEVQSTLGEGTKFCIRLPIGG